MLSSRVLLQFLSGINDLLIEKDKINDEAMGFLLEVLLFKKQPLLENALDGYVFSRTKTIIIDKVP